jgi:flagellar protein FlbD
LREGLEKKRCAFLKRHDRKWYNKASRKEPPMISLHRLNKAAFLLNADLIETIESTPDTLITLTTGKKIIVRDGVEDVVGKIINFRQLCNSTVRVINEPGKDKAAEDAPDNGA